MPSQPPSPSDTIERCFNDAEQARRAGHLDAAREGFDQVLARDPAHADALHAQGLLALAANQLDAARQWLTRAVATRPDPQFYATLCALQIAQGAYVQALQTAQRGLDLKPDSVPLHYYQALALQRYGRPDEAAGVYFTLLDLEPDHPQALANLGAVLKDLGSLSEAERYLRQVLGGDPPNRGARANLGRVLLAAGNYEEGWPYFEDRVEDRAASFAAGEGLPGPAIARLPLPEWRGEPLDGGGGQRLLVVPEPNGSVGDSLQFSRYLPLLLERFSQVGYLCPPPLRRLYEESLSARWPGLVMLDDTYTETSSWDYQCPLMSLPMAFGTRVDNIPASPYLHAHAGRSASWRVRLDALPEPGLPRVGIGWSEAAEERADSLAFTQIAPLLALPCVRWISLQQSAGEPGARARLIDWMDEVTDLADTAALIDNLDLVIATDTPVAHLAAAMGKPVWLLNRFAGSWRWLRQRDDSPWYPAMRLFTQPQRGDWNDALGRLALALQQRYPSGGGALQTSPASPGF